MAWASAKLKRKIALETIKSTVLPVYIASRYAFRLFNSFHPPGYISCTTAVCEGVAFRVGGRGISSMRGSVSQVPIILAYPAAL